MINRFQFQFASDDLSLKYLNQLFGSMQGVLGPGAEITLLGTMFQTFNSIVLVIGALVVVYITVVGVMATAYEGQFMGQKWNNIWIPIRTVLGIAALVPTGSGYSAIQIVMMWVIVQGIGAADTLWNTALAYVKVIGSPYGQVTLPSVGAQTQLQSLFQSIVCAVSTNQALPLFSPTATTYSLGNCGTLSYCDQSATGSCQDVTSLGCLACQAQVIALQAIIQTFTGIAKQYVDADNAYQDFYINSWNQPDNSKWSWIYSYCSAQNPPIAKSQCCIASKNPGLIPQTCQASVEDNCANNTNFPCANSSTSPGPSPTAITNLYWPYALQNLNGTDFINTAVNYYMNLAQTVVTTYIIAQGQTQDFGGALQDAKEQGWIMAGSYYNNIAKRNQSNFTMALPTLSVSPPNLGQDGLYNTRNNYQAASTLEAAAAGTGASAGGGPPPSPGAFGGSSTFAPIGNTITTGMGNVSQAFASTNQTNSDPVSTLTTIGVTMMWVVQTLYSALLVFSLVIGFAGGIDVFVLGTGVTNPGEGMAILLYFVLMPALMALFGIMLTYAGLFSVYIPLIPFIIFTMGAIGWLLSTIEAMVAGPLVALGILTPSGEHDFLGKAAPALMLLFNIFLRPGLMIFGLMAAMLLSVVVVSMINLAFWGPVFQSVLSGSPSIITLIIFISAYVALIMIGLNKSFSAISYIPEHVMNWISGRGEGFGTEVSEIKGAVGGATGGISGAMAGGREKGEAAATKEAQREKELEKREKEEAGKGVKPGGPGSKPGGG